MSTTTVRSHNAKAARKVIPEPTIAFSIVFADGLVDLSLGARRPRQD